MLKKVLTATVGMAVMGATLAVISPASAADPLPRIPGQAPTSDSVTLAVIGDYGGCGVDRTCDMEYAVADLVHSWNADAILTTGDNTYQQGLPEEVVKAQAPYKADIGAGKFYPIMGNHDYGNGCNAASVQPSLDHFKVPAAFVAGFGNNLVDFLNPDVNCNSGSAPAILDAYKAAVSSSTAAWQITGAHQPLYSSGKAGNNPDRGWVAQPGTDLILSGHDHHAEHITTPDGYNVAISGNGGAGLTPLFGATTGSQFRDDSHFGAMRLTVTADSLKSEFVDLENKVRYAFTLKKDAAGKAYISERTPWTDPNAGTGDQNPVPGTNRVAFDTVAASAEGLKAVPYEDGPFEQADVAGRTALQLLRNPRGGGNTMYLHADDAMLSGGPFNATATVQYYSHVAGSFALQYDNAASGSAYSTSASVAVGADQVGQWQTASIPLPGIKFANRQNGGADLRLLAPNNLPLAISGVTIAVEQIPSAAPGPKLDAVEMVIGSEPGGLQWIPYESGPAHDITVDGRVALQLDRNSFNTGNNLYLTADDRYLVGGPYTAMATIEYRSPVAGSFVLQYENQAAGRAYQPTDRVQIGQDNVDRWQTVSLNLDSAMFQNRQNGNADMRIVAANNLPLIISSIRVDLLSTPEQIAARDAVSASEKAARPAGGIDTRAKLTASEQSLASARAKVSTVPDGRFKSILTARLDAVDAGNKAAAEELRIREAIARSTSLLSGISAADLKGSTAIDQAIADLAEARALFVGIPAERRGTLGTDSAEALSRIRDAIGTNLQDQRGGSPAPISDAWLTTVIDAEHTLRGVEGLKERVQGIVNRTATGHRVNDAITEYLAAS